jgi:hypothetical protein
MTYTAFNSTPQPFSDRGLNKIKHLASLPVVDPALISIKCLASRLIGEMDDAFIAITNAPSNDGSEVTVLTLCGGIPSNPYWWRGERIEIDGAFNQLIGDTFDKLNELIRTWWRKHFRVWIGFPLARPGLCPLNAS